MALVVLLLVNLLIAMMVHTYQKQYEKADKIWRLRWTSYVLRCGGPAVKPAVK